MQGFRKTLALTRHIGLLALALWVPTAPAADYPVTVLRDAQNYYVDKSGWNGVIKTNYCYEDVAYDEATLRLTTFTTGSLIFSSGTQCPVVNVFDPDNLSTGSFPVWVSSDGNGYYESTDGFDLIKTTGNSYVTNAAAQLTFSQVVGGAVYGGTLKIGNFYPETATNLYIRRQGYVPPPLPTPNLTISAFSATPTAVNVGGTSTLAATVRNIGDSSSGATMLRYYERTGSVWSAIPTCANNVGSLAPGATSVQSCHVTPSIAGEYVYKVGADPVPGEGDTTDNESAPIKVTVDAAPTAPPTAFTVGGTVSGLTGSVALRNNAGDNLVRNTNGTFTFATALPSPGAYAVTVVSQPAGQTCSVANGNGTIASANVTNVAVTCVTETPAPLNVSMVIPLVAQTASYTSAITVRNPYDDMALPISVFYTGAIGSWGVGHRVCTPLNVPPLATVQFSAAAQCALPSGNQFGYVTLTVSDDVPSPFIAFSRTRTPGGNGFSVPAYPTSAIEAPGLGQYVVGLERQAAAPTYQTNCFVASMDAATPYQIRLLDATGKQIGYTIDGSLEAHQMVRYLDIFAAAGMGAGDLSNVSADFSNGSSNAALIGFCTVQESTFFGADFRMAQPPKTWRYDPE